VGSQNEGVRILTSEERRLNLRRRQLQARRDSMEFSETPEPDMSLWGRLKDNVLGVDDGVQSYGETGAAVLNKAGESMTFGAVGDEAAGAFDAAVGRGNYGDRRDFYRKQETDLEESHPALSLGADVGGALAGVMIPGGLAMKGAGLARRVAGSAVAGGVGSGVYGFAEGEGGFDPRIDAAKSAAKVGAGIGAVIPVAGAGINMVANSLLGKRAISAAAKNAPTTEQLRRQGSQAYQAVDDMGVSIKPSAFKRATDGISSDMMDRGMDDLPGPGSLTPLAGRFNQVMGEMNSEMAADPTASLPFKAVDRLRRKAGAVASTQDPTDAALGSSAIGGIDDFIRNLSPGDVDAGDAKAIGPAIEKARDTWAKMSRSQTIDDAIGASEDYLSGGSSGIRNQFKRILRSDKLSRGFSDAEKKVMKRVVNGSFPEQILNLVGGGLGQLGAIGGGIATGSPLGAVAGLGIAAGARKGSEALSRKNAEVVRAIIANGGMKEMPQAAPKLRAIAEKLLRHNGAAVQQ